MIDLDALRRPGQKVKLRGQEYQLRSPDDLNVFETEELQRLDQDATPEALLRSVNMLFEQDSIPDGIPATRLLMLIEAFFKPGEAPDPDPSLSHS